MRDVVNDAKRPPNNGQKLMKLRMCQRLGSQSNPSWSLETANANLGRAEAPNQPCHYGWTCQVVRNSYSAATAMHASVASKSMICSMLSRTWLRHSETLLQSDDAFVNQTSLRHGTL